MDQYIWHDNTNVPYVLETITFTINYGDKCVACKFAIIS